MSESSLYISPVHIHPKDMSMQTYVNQPEIFDQLPDLTETIATDNIDYWVTRLVLAMHAHVPLDFLGICQEQAEATSSPLIIVNHKPIGTSIKENLQVLTATNNLDLNQLVESQGPPLPLKTISLLFPTGQDKFGDPTHALILYSGLGDFHLANETKFNISTALGISRKKARSATINPSFDDLTFDTNDWCKRRFGYIAGLVKPLLETHTFSNLDALCFQHPAKYNLDKHMFFTVSPVDSIVMSVPNFLTAFQNYADQAYKYTEVQIPNHTLLLPKPA